jgi:hypothetical protein
VGTKVLGKLHRCTTDGARGAIDKYTFAAAQFTPSEKVQHGCSTKAESSSLLEAQI